VLFTPLPANAFATNIAIHSRAHNPFELAGCAIRSLRNFRRWHDVGAGQKEKVEQ
jgi:hypothetical protein